MALDQLVIYGLAFSSMGCTAAISYPFLSRIWLRLFGRVEQYKLAKVGQAVKELDDIFIDVQPLWIEAAYGVGPFIVGLLLFILFDNLLLASVGVIAGVVVPDMWVRQTRAQRKRKFNSQLVDSLFLLSSSLRAGLSMVQALEAVEAEMPPPISQEIGLVVKAHKVGLPLEDALQRMNQRMASEELNLTVTALLLARGTGGDVTRVVDQLVGTIREKRKLLEKVGTLTLQGRLQAYVMSGLPVFFAFFVRSFTPDYFDIMFSDPTGRFLMAVVVCLWVVGMVLLFKFCKVEV